MNKFLIVLGEIVVILILIIGVDYLPWFICWFPFTIYNVVFASKLEEHVNQKYL